MKLSDAKIGIEYSIDYLENNISNRFSELGFIPGQRITKLTSGIVRCGSSRYALGYEVLKDIQVN